MNNLRILLVEDDPGLCLLFRRMLEKLGHGVVDSVPLEPAAIETIRHLDPDLILVDVVLNETVDSLELAGELMSDFGIPGIMISNHGMEHLMERDACVMRYQYLRKPFFVNDLAHAISQALLPKSRSVTDRNEPTPAHSATSDTKPGPERKPSREARDKSFGQS